MKPQENKNEVLSKSFISAVTSFEKKVGDATKQLAEKRVAECRRLIKKGVTLKASLSLTMSATDGKQKQIKDAMRNSIGFTYISLMGDKEVTINLNDGLSIHVQACDLLSNGLQTLNAIYRGKTVKKGKGANLFSILTAKDKEATPPTQTSQETDNGGGSEPKEREDSLTMATLHFTNFTKCYKALNADEKHIMKRKIVAMLGDK